jgi:2-hydroxychromene-2-carboxylate isomerase
MSKTVTFCFSLLSPWVYFSGPRFQQLLQRTGATAVYRPIGLFRVFRETGGTPLKDLHPSRRAYRALERRRWATLLGVPISDQPRHHPVDESQAARLLIAWQASDPSAPVWPLAQSLLAAVWIEDLDIADPATLATLAARHGLDGAALLQRAGQADIGQAYEAYTDEAMAAGVFGVPSFVVDGELFFGQDRLEFVERALGR